MSKKTRPRAYSTHKRRTDWYLQSTAWPDRDVLGQDLPDSGGRSTSPNGPATWSCVGPTNISGRMTCLVVHPKRPEEILAGAAGGGVWATSDAGASWRSASSGLLRINVGALGLDGRDRDHPVVYVGTGEANLSADNYPGGDLFKSEDWGANWKPIATKHAFGSGSRISAILPNPHRDGHVLLGAVGHSHKPKAAGGGLFSSDDYCATWERIVVDKKTGAGPGTFWCHSVVFSPLEPGLVLVAITAQGPSNGIWRSDDGGSSWTQAWDGLPEASRIERTSLAFAPSDASVVYAQCADQFGGVLGVFQSRNGGSSWREIGLGHFAGERQMSYNNTIAVHPKDSDAVICGGVDLNRPGFSGDSIAWENQSHGKKEQVFAGGQGARRALGLRAGTGARLTMVGDAVDRGEDWLFGRDAPKMGASVRA